MQAIDIYHSALIALNNFQNISDKKIELQSPEPAPFCNQERMKTTLILLADFFLQKKYFQFSPFYEHHRFFRHSAFIHDFLESVHRKF